MLAGQSSTVISWSADHLEVVLALWAGAKVLLEKEISISIKLVSRWKHKVLQNLLVDGCIDFGLWKKAISVFNSRYFMLPKEGGGGGGVSISFWIYGSLTNTSESTKF